MHIRRQCTLYIYERCMLTELLSNIELAHTLSRLLVWSQAWNVQSVEFNLHRMCTRHCVELRLHVHTYLFIAMLVLSTGVHTCANKLTIGHIMCVYIYIYMSACVYMHVSACLHTYVHVHVFEHNYRQSTHYQVTHDLCFLQTLAPQSLTRSISYATINHKHIEQRTS